MEKYFSAITVKSEHARVWKAFHVLQTRACSREKKQCIRQCRNIG